MAWLEGNGPEKPSRPIQVIGLGQACVDYLGCVPGYPAEDTKTELEELVVSCGGPAATALIVLARAGIGVSFLGSISDDPFGLQIVDGLQREGVDTCRLQISPGLRSQFAFIAVNKEDGRRTIFWKRSTAPELIPQEVSLDSFPGARILHVDGLMVEAGTEAAIQAKKRGMTVVMDAGTLRDGTLDLVKHVHVLIGSETFAHALTGKGGSQLAALEKIRSLGPGQAVITLGPQGSIGLDQSGVVRQPAFQVVARDTTGAGDVYHGAYIYGLLGGWDMARCMEFASAAAAVKCRNGGGWQGVPGLKEIEAMIAQGSVSGGSTKGANGTDRDKPL